VITVGASDEELENCHELQREVVLQGQPKWCGPDGYIRELRTAWLLYRRMPSISSKALSIFLAKMNRPSITPSAMHLGIFANGCDDTSSISVTLEITLISLLLQLPQLSLVSQML
jgi:hypothetical protein